MIVVDTNLVAYLFIPGDQTDANEQVIQRDPTWAAPLLRRSELRSVLTMYMRQQGRTVAQALSTMMHAEELIGGREYALPSDDFLQMTDQTTLSAYDTEFVALAQSLGIPLVTTDGKILKQVPTTAVSPEQFLSAR